MREPRAKHDASQLRQWLANEKEYLIHGLASQEYHQCHQLTRFLRLARIDPFFGTAFPFRQALLARNLRRGGLTRVRSAWKAVHQSKDFQDIRYCAGGLVTCDFANAAEDAGIR
jgi:hypothetical protein